MRYNVIALYDFEELAADSLHASRMVSRSSCCFWYLIVMHICGDVQSPSSPCFVLVCGADYGARPDRHINVLTKCFLSYCSGVWWACLMGDVYMVGPCPRHACVSYVSPGERDNCFCEAVPQRVPTLSIIPHYHHISHGTPHLYNPFFCQQC